MVLGFINIKCRPPHRTVKISYHWNPVVNTTSRASSDLPWCSMLEQQQRGSHRLIWMDRGKRRWKTETDGEWKEAKDEKERGQESRGGQALITQIWRWCEKKRETSRERGSTRPRTHYSRERGEIKGPAVSASNVCVRVCSHSECSLGLCNSVRHVCLGAGRSCGMWRVWQHAQSSAPSLIHYTAHAHTYRDTYKIHGL